MISKKRAANQPRQKAEEKRRRLLKAASIQAARGWPVRAGQPQPALAGGPGGWANPVRGGELKFIDTTGAFAPAFATATFTTPAILLNGVAPGSTAETRVGRKITMKSLYIRYNWARGGPTSTGGSPARILVVYDKQTNANLPQITDILLTDHYLSQNNLSNRDRFITLFDHITEPISDAANACVSATLFKGMNLDVMFNGGAAGTVGDITSGSVVVFVAQSSKIGTVTPALDIRSRIRFTDI